MNCAEVKSARSQRVIRIAVGVFIFLSCLKAWVSPGTLLQPAEAQIPDAGLQRKQTLEAIERTNILLLDIKSTLETKPLNVRIVGADNKADAAPRATNP